MVACMVAFLLSKTILEILLEMGFVKVVSYILSLYETDGNVFFKAKFLITLFEVFIFCTKIQLWFPVRTVDILGEKLVKKCCGFGLFSSVDNFDFTRKIVKKIWMKNSLRFCQNWILGQKFDFSNSVIALKLTNQPWKMIFGEKLRTPLVIVVTQSNDSSSTNSQ